MEAYNTDYLLRSAITGKLFADQGFMLELPGEAGLLRAVYACGQLELKGPELGLYTFADWMPLHRLLQGSSAPITFRSNGLGKHLGLENLWVTFSGYWPEKGATMKTCSFKETEAYSVCARMSGLEEGVLVVASAGNTARSFARVCSDNHIPLLLCVPQDSMDALWFDTPLEDKVKIVVTASGSDYYDAIHLSNQACMADGFFPEGGAKNVARRDGMGTTVLSAATTIGLIPEYYFQAVGSGTGAIAAWEANLRLLEDGRYGHHKMKLMLSQNIPFHPLYDAWQAGSRELFPMDDNVARQQVEIIDAKVLSNRRPPYGIAGGLYDALVDTGGEIFLVSNTALRAAADLFFALEGIDIHPAAAVAVASLIQAREARKIKAGSVVMLNITGGGESLFKSSHTLYRPLPDVIFPVQPDQDEVKRKLDTLF